jgi:phage tail-like protein
MSVDVVEYRNGNEKESSVRKLTGLARYPDVTLKRGIIGSLDLYSWLNDIRNGDEAAYRTVTVQLMDEDHTQVAQTWKLLRAPERRRDRGAHARVRAARAGVSQGAARTTRSQAASKR